MPVKNLARFITVLIVCLWSQLSQAHEPNEFDFQIVDVANRYTTAVNAAKRCGRYSFENKGQEESFKSNMDLSKIYAVRIFMRVFPDFSREELKERAETMDQKIDTTMDVFYAQSGCSHQLIQTFVQWFDDFKRAPKAPYPKPNLSDADFDTMGMWWIVFNR
ncbi:hypothetical protein CQ054_22795 [Ochrobactrum sp. MYb29]|nr:hypothetical protein CQ054_22795 [Ochrobactrum sp. MYb29]